MFAAFWNLYVIRLVLFYSHPLPVSSRKRQDHRGRQSSSFYWLWFKNAKKMENATQYFNVGSHQVIPQNLIYVERRIRPSIWNALRDLCLSTAVVHSLKRYGYKYKYVIKEECPMTLVCRPHRPPLYSFIITVEEL